MKVTTEKKKPFIDMTAMSDVTVLLLTFFMLTSTFLQKEPATVITPPSVSEEKVPEQNLVTVLVTPESQIFISISGDGDSTYSSEKVRAEIFKSVVEKYNAAYPNKAINITNKDVEVFSKTHMFGLPFAKLKEWCGKSTEDRDKMLDPKNAKNPSDVGIPIDMRKEFQSNPNEFQRWMLAIRDNTFNANLKEAIRSGKGIAIKADANTPYEVVQVVMDNLQTMKMNKFTLMTALKTEEQ